MAPSEPVVSPSTQHYGHQRNKPSVIKNLAHRRQPSKGEALVPAEAQSAEIHTVISHEQPASTAMGSSGPGHFAKNNPGALGELQQNQQEAAPRLARPSQDKPRSDTRSRSRSPTKNVFANAFRSTSSKDAKHFEPRDVSPSKTKKNNLAGILTRPKSLKNLYKFAAEEEERLSKDKENRTPDSSLDLAPPPPIYAQFTSDASVRGSMDAGRHISNQEATTASRPQIKERPRSYQLLPNVEQAPKTHSSNRGTAAPQDSTSGHRGRTFGALTGGRGHARTKSAAPSPTSSSSEPVLDPKDIDKHLEAMLDRRNIPENQRYKMRNLNDTIKMEFIRQDWAEMQAAKAAERPGTKDSMNSKEGDSAVANESDVEGEKHKRTRGRSFTFSRGRKESRSPSKKSREGTLGRHFRSKSTESVVSDRPTSSAGPTTTGNSFLSKIKLQQGPADYVAYLRKVQKPEAVEVGKLHKLRLLLRNETVAWIEDFIQQGGMMEIVGLLNRIMEVEWREEHEDALLHENLLCLKALCTTARAIQHVHSIHADLFPKLLHMLFDPERKGPSEFTTRNIITSILFTYIESASPAERVARAKNVLRYLRDQEPKDDERPLPFVMEMRQERPYRVWNKEVVSVTKEVFWIFLHNLNVVNLPSDHKSSASDLQDGSEAPYAYMQRHFPPERPPVPAAPYVGGVEWDATNYLASHLDLMNAIIACTPTSQGRNTIRAELRMSGWERCMGSSLRLCKEKFYSSVHDGLRTWVAAAAQDGWAVKDVRFGPPPSESVRSSPKKTGQKQKPEEAAPKLDMPKLDFELSRASPTPVTPGQAANDGWIL